MVTVSQPAALVPDERPPSPEPRISSPVTRYRSLNAWRGFACIAVVLHHASGAMMLRNPELASLAVFKVCQFGYFGVPIFFVISGYCIANSACTDMASRAGVRYFAISRMRRILPPYWLSALAYALLKLVILLLVAAGWARPGSLASDNSVRGDILYYLSNATLTQYVFHRGFISPVFWTLCYEAAFYLIVGCAMLMAWRNKRALLHILYATTLSCILLAIMAPAGGAIYPLDLWPQFGLGVLVYDLATGSRARNRRAQVWGGLIALGFLAEASLHKFSTAPLTGGGTFAAAIGFAILIALLHRADPQLGRNPVNWLVAKVGKVSYSLYLTHYLVLALLLKILWPSLLGSHPYGSLLFLAAVPIALAPLFFRALEQPFMASPRKTPLGCLPFNDH